MILSALKPGNPMNTLISLLNLR
uniref:Uncharacterized protein n=1 Tax=Anguilla anguilla TaxID=7936 RepID=A0A0E9XU47_ANGAN